MLNKQQKTSVIQDFGVHALDTGSAEVQVALLTTRINDLRSHFEAFPKDVASKKGLMKMVNRRRSLLKYLQDHSVAKYEEIIARLGLRK